MTDGEAGLPALVLGRYAPWLKDAERAALQVEMDAFASTEHSPRISIVSGRAYVVEYGHGAGYAELEAEVAALEAAREVVAARRARAASADD